MRRLNVVLYGMAIAVLLIAGTAEAADRYASGRFDQSLRYGETRETLNPDTFTNSWLRQAHQAAKNIPWVLDSLYCACLCEESPAFRHKSLLSCYVDGHAAT
jgi:hypothetical protein